MVREHTLTALPARLVPLRAHALVRRLRLWTVPLLLLVDGAADALGGSGMYFCPWDGAFLTGGAAVDVRRRGCVLLAGDLDDADAGNTLAHELRHAWQHERGKMEHPSAAFDWSAAGYDDSFTRWARSPSERDAVLWSQRVAPSPSGEWLAERAGWI